MPRGDNTLHIFGYDPESELIGPGRCVTTALDQATFEHCAMRMDEECFYPQAEAIYAWLGQTDYPDFRWEWLAGHEDIDEADDDVVELSLMHVLSEAGSFQATDFDPDAAAAGEE